MKLKKYLYSFATYVFFNLKKYCDKTDKCLNLMDNFLQNFVFALKNRYLKLKKKSKEKYKFTYNKFYALLRFHGKLKFYEIKI